MGNQLPPFKVLGVITITAGTPLNLADVFSDQLQGSCFINTMFFQAHEGNASDYVWICDRDYVAGDDNMRGACLAAREYINLTSGTQSNCLDIRDFRVDCSAGQKKVRVMILKV